MTSSSQASYQQAEEPVSQLINDFGPPVASPALARQRAAMPFVHLERELWDLRDAAGTAIPQDVPERRTWLLDRGATGRLQPEIERLLADPANLAAAAILPLDRHFTPVLSDLICAAVDLDVPALDAEFTRISRVYAPHRRRLISSIRWARPSIPASICSGPRVKSRVHEWIRTPAYRIVVTRSVAAL